MNNETCIYFANEVYVEHLYSQYVKNPDTFDQDWRHFFEKIEQKKSANIPLTIEKEEPTFKILRLIEAYRKLGYKGAAVNPLFPPPALPEALALSQWGFEDKALDKYFPSCGILKEEQAPLKNILATLKKIYCGKVGFECMHVESKGCIPFIQHAIEHEFDSPLNREKKIEIFKGLSEATFLELFLQKKYPGQKRFSLEGGETLIPMLKELIQLGADQGIEEIVLGMSHRGRLNVLVNVLGKSVQALCQAFETGGDIDGSKGYGDVKYHQGYCADIATPIGKTVRTFLYSNPSHLEAVSGVVQGHTRGRQALKGADGKKSILPLLIHGEAAFVGQGVVYETFQLSRLKGYETGGTIHIIINNQVGFTATKEEIHSMSECTDIGKAFGIPIFHLNGEEPEKGLKVIALALEIRQRFQCDVLIELNCYRKRGHNESDEPTFTNPKLYEQIQQKTAVSTLYLHALVKEGIFSQEEGKDIETKVKKRLETPSIEQKKPIQQEKPCLLEFSALETGIPLQTLLVLAEKCTTFPPTFHIHPKLKRLFEKRSKMISGNLAQKTIDWGMAECLTYASLLTQGIAVRLSGQDSIRGTFSHRHAALVDQKTNELYSPLSHLEKGQAPFEGYNSPLIEYAVMGFEYGYSVAFPKGLIIWEGQFGDFANGAQIIIDQFLTSGKEKWNISSSLTLFLPHGYEGQGPEHSSARIERFLQLAANNALRIVIPTTPAQLFHLLRTQALSDFRIPLILFTPKSLLRYAPSFSPSETLISDRFQTVIDEASDPQVIWRVIFCSGKVYYDLQEKRKKEGIAIIRIEQLYPLDIKKLQTVIEKYRPKTEWIWVQEEPENMGAYSFIRPFLENLLPEKGTLRYVGRKRSASPAAGSERLHKEELETLLQKALNT